MGERITEAQLAVAEQGASYETESLCAEIRASWAERDEANAAYGGLEMMYDAATTYNVKARKDNKQLRAINEKLTAALIDILKWEETLSKPRAVAEMAFIAQRALSNNCQPSPTTAAAGTGDSTEAAVTNVNFS